MRLLVTGGAGYIGAHTVRALLRDDHEVVVVDDLSTGHPELVPDGVPLHVGSVLDFDLLMEVIGEHRVQGVVHLAAHKAVEESIARPFSYYRTNVVGMQTLLTAMVSVGVSKIVFSSSAAVYGTPNESRVTEDSPTVPESPYGRTKLVCEWLLRDAAAATKISWTALRYFNVAGAGEQSLADRGVHNLVPRIFDAVSSGTRPQVYGNGYPTSDGTCVRDYVHVADVADAHAAVVRRMAHVDLATTYNVGRGRGASVLEVMRAVRRSTGIDFEWDVTAARPGDPAAVVADVEKIRTELDWSARRDLDEMVDSAWRAWSSWRPTARTITDRV